MRQPAIEAAEIGAAEAGDMALVRQALARDPDAFRAIIKTYNQRLYRLARGVVRNDAEAEDVLQEAYMRAFTSLQAFRGEASLSTWLSRIVINEALGRLRKRKRIVAMPGNPEAQIIRFPLNQNDLNPGDDPERTMAQRQILRLVERATDSLPDVYRTVFVARVIEGLSIEETADLLGVKPETVKTRLHRARALVRKALDDEIGPVLLDAFPFAGRRCERLTQAVMRRLGFEP
ncbi:RNA polymerase sigma factor [Mesorhizobium sp. B4-1-3]|uniref:RNA polymerase sigma factor n=1 Tax=Mesorhizobium sp. B4-1-3 TaxID=2589889 RepID=UPI00112E12DF|nr:RNA polymerase sigma factor [Mesorhizobium sp. B4-1-3]TPI14081.1 RNA polymerase sigma factor [Mesorhizobium sp. B4-1-3]